jgi:hypothetical protein
MQCRKQTVTAMGLLLLLGGNLTYKAVARQRDPELYIRVPCSASTTVWQCDAMRGRLVLLSRERARAVVVSESNDAWLSRLERRYSGTTWSSIMA